MKNIFAASAILFICSDPVFAKCGDDFKDFINFLKMEAIELGHSSQNVETFFESVSQDQAVLKADRSQGFFQKPFTEFSSRLISNNRLDTATRNLKKYKFVFDEIDRKYGIPRGIITAFWAFETDFGSFQGDVNTINALTTLAHDCRRPDLFRPQIFAAIELFEKGLFDPKNTTGAWAGETGMVQMLPEDILQYGIDGDGDGIIDLKGSAPDALMSAAGMLSGLGWQSNQPWLREVSIPNKNFPWQLSGTNNPLPVSKWLELGVSPSYGQIENFEQETYLIAPEGHKGPKFLAYPNLLVLTEWNQSLVYILTAAYFANILEGSPKLNPGSPTPPLSKNELMRLQTHLSKSADVGGIDGILGSKTRAAVQGLQFEINLIPAGGPTVEILRALK
jgi:lytic murein transglycosylase